MPGAGSCAEAGGEKEFATTQVGGRKTSAGRIQICLEGRCDEDVGNFKWGRIVTTPAAHIGGGEVGGSKPRCGRLGSGRAGGAPPKCLAKEWPRAGRTAQTRAQSGGHLVRQQWHGRTVRPSGGLGQRRNAAHPAGTPGAARRWALRQNVERGMMFSIRPKCQGSEPRQVHRGAGWHGHRQAMGKLATPWAHGFGGPWDGPRAWLVEPWGRHGGAARGGTKRRCTKDCSDWPGDPSPWARSCEQGPAKTKVLLERTLRRAEQPLRGPIGRTDGNLAARTCARGRSHERRAEHGAELQSEPPSGCQNCSGAGAVRPRLSSWNCSACARRRRAHDAAGRGWAVVGAAHDQAHARRARAHDQHDGQVVAGRLGEPPTPRQLPGARQEGVRTM